MALVHSINRVNTVSTIIYDPSYEVSIIIMPINCQVKSDPGSRRSDISIISKLLHLSLSDSFLHCILKLL